MSHASLTTALCLPALEIEALLQGRMMVAISQTFRNPPQFVLCPVAGSHSSRTLRARYRPSFLRSVKTSQSKKLDSLTTLYAWAKFDACRIYTQSHDLDALSKLTIWTTGHLQELVSIQQKIFLMTLQVYRFERPVPVMMEPPKSHQAGCYIRLPYAPAYHSGDTIISPEAFARRKQQLFDLSPPAHPELETLQAELVQLRESAIGAMSLDRDLRYLLGWSRTDQTLLYDSDLAWIKQISKAGNANDSHSFNLLIRQSLNKLGFETNPTISEQFREPVASAIATTTGGLGICCDAPYLIFAYCQATGAQLAQSHSSRSRPETCIVTPLITQLLNLGSTCLRPETFACAVKIIFFAGPLPNADKQAAIEYRINVMHPETLQRLAELQAQHPGCIDLYKLKPYLQTAPFAEEADDKVNRFIDDTLQQLEVRAEIIRAVKKCMNNTGEQSVGTEAVFFLYAANATQNELPELSHQEMQEILVELSSPLAGYLGRIEESEAPDARRSHRFYFLRELHIEHSALATRAI